MSRRASGRTGMFDWSPSAVVRMKLEGGQATSERAATVSAPGENLGREGFMVMPGGGRAFLPDDLPRAKLLIFPAEPNQSGGE